MLKFEIKMVNGKDSKIANILYIYMFLKNSQNQYKSDWLKLNPQYVILSLSGKISK
jgi:hypothetical protein